MDKHPGYGIGHFATLAGRIFGGWNRMSSGVSIGGWLALLLGLAACVGPAAVGDAVDGPVESPAVAREIAPDPAVVAPPGSGDLSPAGSLVAEQVEGQGIYHYLLGHMMLRDHKWQEAEEAFTRVSELDPDANEALLLVASLATQRGDLPKAEKFSRQLVDKEPGNQRGRLLLAGIYMATKEYDKAAGHYEALLALDSDNDQARLLLAQIYGYLHKAESARGVLYPLLRQEEMAWKAHLALGRAYVNQGDNEKAIVPFREAVRTSRNRLEAVLALGALLQEMGRGKEAEAVYRTHLKHNPDNSVVHGRLGRLFLDQDNRDAALSEFRAIAQLSPDSVQARLTTALILMSQEKLQDALKELRLAEAVQPDNAGVRYYLGQVLETLDQDREAFAQYEKIPRDESFHIDSQLRMSFLEAKDKKYKEAVQRVQKLLEQDDKRPEIYVALSILLLQEKDYAAVVDICNRGLVVDAGQDRLVFNRAMALDKMGRWAEAEKDLQAFLAKNPEDAHALNYLGYTWADRNENLDKAYEMLKKAALLSPGDGFITDSLGWVLYRLNRLEESLSVMKEAVRMEPEDPAILEHLGDVYQAMGKHGDAVSTWQRALQLDPKNESLPEKIRRLQLKN